MRRQGERMRARWMARTRRQQVVLLIAVPILLFVGLTSINRAVETTQLRSGADRVRGEIAALQARNAELVRQRQFLDSNEYIERIAREELDLVKPGETAIVIVTPREQQRAQQTGLPEPPPAPPPANWRQWFDHFFGDRPASA